MKFNEDSRVKIPALLHLMRLGYRYIPQNQQHRIQDNNIFKTIFIKNVCRINTDLSEKEAEQILDETSMTI